MMQKPSSKTGIGFASAIGAYTLWGVLPIYWKFLAAIPAMEILAHRILWSCVFLICMLFMTRRIGQFCDEVCAIWVQPRKVFGVFAASVLVTLNWLTYIWAVNNDQIIETSLGYYINPLVNVLFGVVILKEKLSFWHKVSVILASLGVLNLTIHFGVIPWIALSLAISFGLYGLCKKLLNIGAVTSITLETLLLSPISLIYLAYLYFKGVAAFQFDDSLTLGLLAGSGIVTAVPMVLFTNGANYLPLTIVGFIQFLSPTIALIVGIFLYHEAFSVTHLLSFSCIWVSLIIFSATRTAKVMSFLALLRNKMRRLVASSDKVGSKH
jgi:chloramphenicol-sensitive protein RarD